MTMKETNFEFAFTHPAPQPPDWQKLVERWYQLDSPSYGLCEFYSQNAQALQKLRPDIIFLASTEGSTPTDWSFASTGAASPAKFVHTLPNVRASSLCQVMNWYGPVICIQQGACSFQKALTEAQQYLKANSGTAWVLGHQERAPQNLVLACVLTALP